MVQNILSWTLTTLTTFILPASLAVPSTPKCKSTPGSSSWPDSAQWETLNKTINGRLLKPAPQAAVCHPSSPIYNLELCKSTPWTKQYVYSSDPLGIMQPNWNNDSCLPDPKYPCSREGFPIYVINATSAEHVAAGVAFARNHNIRLNVKGTGHDYLGRSNAPNSLSIWTRHIQGIEFHNSFKPAGCDHCDGVPAVTLGAGEEWGQIYKAAHAHDLTLVGGTADTMGLGGYLTGGGHSPLSAMFGLAVDQILEMQVVLASGEIVTANQVKHSDLFWAMRGGGGATFGVMTSVTLKTFPEMPVAIVNFAAGGAPNSEAFWKAAVYFMQQAPKLQESNIMYYSYIASSANVSGTEAGGMQGQFLLPNGTVEELESGLAYMSKYISSIPGIQGTFKAKQFSSLYARYEVYKNQDPCNINEAIGSRLLDAKALSDPAALKKAMEVTIPKGLAANVNLVSGPGGWKAKPAGGSNALNPGWRNSYLEYVIGVTWPYLDNTEEHKVRKALSDVFMPALAELAPNTGSYINEGDVNQPNFHSAYWGDNYPRLASIKRQVDPTDVFWCAVCVGNENWKVEDNVLCRV